MAAGSTYTPIATTTLASAQASYTFSSIPGTYTDLIIAINGYETVSSQNMYIQFNGDTSTNYSGTTLYGNGTSALSARSSSFAYTYIDRQGNGTGFGTGLVNVMNYANTSTYKTTLIRYGYAGVDTETTVGLWRSTAAITSITIAAGGSASLASGSSFTLYGIAAA